MEFYFHPFSPPSRSVWMTLEALGLEYDPKELNLFKGEHKSDEYRTKNPRCKVPALIDGELCLAESRAVAMYLANKYGDKQGKPNLYPKDPETRAKVDQQLFVDENLIDGIIAYVNPGGIIFRKEEHNLEKIDGVKAALKWYDDQLGNHKFVATDELTIADFFAVCAIKLLSTVTGYELKEYKNIMRWLPVMEALPYYEKTVKEPTEKQGAFFQSKIAEWKK